MLAFRRRFHFEDEDSGGGEEGREKGYYHIRKAELAESVGGRKDRTVCAGRKMKKERKDRAIEKECLIGFG